ncbi:MAG: response regulator [Elusimicrobia bacterium]|nr:response regulator [Elusimicrobiota bacterium]
MSPSAPAPGAAVVLIVDDCAVNRALVQATLRGEGYRILQAVDGLSGLSAALQDKPDLLIVDMMMPGMSGGDLIRRLREKPGAALPRTLLLTALSEQEGRAAAAQVGADASLTKPCPPATLRALVREMLAAAMNSRI